MKERQYPIKLIAADLVVGLLVQLYLCFPWIRTDKGNYSGITYLYRGIFQHNFKDIFQEDFSVLAGVGPEAVAAFAGLFELILIMMTVVQGLVLVGMICALCRHPVGICTTVSMPISMAIPFLWTISVNDAGAGLSISYVLPLFTYLYPLFLCIVGMAHFIIIRAASQWDEASRKQKEEMRRLKEYKKERKRRLRFPGRYSSLYYRVVWKDLWRRRSDYFFLMLAGMISFIFLYAGVGIRSIFVGSYGDEVGMAGFGLISIMGDFIVVSIVIALLLLTVVLSYYERRRVANSGLFEILGIRQNALSATWYAEIGSCFVLSVLGGIGIGKGLLFLFRMWAQRSFPEFGILGVPGWGASMTAIGIMFVTALFAYGISREIEGEKRYLDARGAAVKDEPLPARYGWLRMGVALIVAALALYLFSQRRMGEGVVWFAIFLLGMSIVLRNVWGIRVKRWLKHPEKNLGSLLKRNAVRYRFKTTTQYILMLGVIHVCVLFFFMMKLVSNQIAEKPEDTYPYDYVCLANESDQALFDKMRTECEADIITFPMVRATTVDNTERLQNFMEIMIPQGQNIGISESTYWSLKELAGEKGEGDLGLDEEGLKIHIVYQQDKGVKAHPIDWYLATNMPHVHIGQPVLYYHFMRREQIFVPRLIAGEEVSCLTGYFRQGAYENLIVFSDAYFDSVKDQWKTTDIYSGLQISEEEAVPGENVYQGPSLLQLINVPKEYGSQADAIIKEFRKNHSYDEKFDSMVKSAYSRTDALRQRKLERIMESSVNALIMGMLLLASLFLLHVKVRIELSDMKKEYQFLECFGMRKKERVRLERKSISKFVWLPLILAVIVTAIFTAVVFKLRAFEMEDMVRYGMLAGKIALGYVAAQFLNLWLLQYMVVRKVEGSIGK